MTRATAVALTLVGCAAVLYTLWMPPAASRSYLLAAQSRGAAQAPVFEVDPFWPKPLPNHWVTGSTIGVSVDAQDNVWTIHRPNSVDDNFRAADIMVGDARGRDDEARPGAGSSQQTPTPTPAHARRRGAAPP